VHDAVDEQRRRSPHLARGDPALDVTANAVQHPGAGPIAVERVDVESELAGVPQQVVVVERALAVEEHLVHLPEAILQRGGLGRGGRRERVRVDLGQREVAEGEADVAFESALDERDLPERPPGVRALVVAVFDDDATCRCASDVVDRIVQRLHLAPAHFQGLDLGDHAVQRCLVGQRAHQHYAFTNTLSEEESAAVYERYHIPAPGRWVWDGVLANVTPGHQATWVDYRNDDRAPLLLIAGGEDHIMPAAVNKENADRYEKSAAHTDYKEFERRDHYTVGAPGWEKVADYALTWATEHAPWSRRVIARRQAAG